MLGCLRCGCGICFYVFWQRLVLVLFYSYRVVSTCAPPASHTTLPGTRSLIWIRMELFSSAHVFYLHSLHTRPLSTVLDYFLYLVSVLQIFIFRHLSHFQVCRNLCRTLLNWTNHWHSVSIFSREKQRSYADSAIHESVFDTTDDELRDCMTLPVFKLKNNCHSCHCLVYHNKRIWHQWRLRRHVFFCGHAYCMLLALRFGSQQQLVHFLSRLSTSSPPYQLHSPAPLKFVKTTITL